MKLGMVDGRWGAARCALVAALCAGLSPSGCFALFGNAEGYCAELAGMVCHDLFECCPARYLEEVMGDEFAKDEGRCRQDVELSCREDHAEQLYAVEQGTVEFDKDRAIACLDAQREPGECVVLEDDPALEEACEESPWVGLQGDGADCMWAFECKADHFCDGVKCRALPGEGETCTGSCAAGLYCGSDGGGLVCLRYKGEGESCSSSGECAEDLYCSQTCRTRQPGGASCTSDDQCASYECSSGTCPDGSYCTSDASCDSTCAGSGDLCYDDLDCPGSCSTAATTCSYDYDCPTGETCVHEACEDATCEGRVCGAQAPTEINYCSVALGHVYPGFP